MTTTEITSEDVAAWLTARRDECIAIAPRGAVSFEVKSDNFGGSKGPRVTFRAYSDKLGHTGENKTGEDAIASFRELAGAYSPQEKARKSREAAAALLAEAEELERGEL